jgi:hypothetical protein
MIAHSRSFLLLLSVVATGIATVWRYSLILNDGDLVSYAPYGIAQADKSAFVNDWTLQNAVMPHWSFELVTYVGARLGMLDSVYIAYWLVSIVALCAGLLTWSLRFAPEYPWLCILAGPCIAIGPVALAGSTTPLMGTPIPHYLGGSLAILSLGSLASRRVTASILFGGLTSFVHVQHGFNVCIIMLAAGCLPFFVGRERRTLLGSATLLAIGSYLAATRPGLLGSSQDLLKVCMVHIPFHCYAVSWSFSDVIWPFVYFGITLVLSFPLLWRDRLTMMVVLIPMLVVSGAVLSDRWSIPIAGDLARASNAYRFITLFYPIAVVSLLSAIASREAWVRIAGAIGLELWFVGPSSMYENQWGPALSAALLVIFATRARQVAAVGSWPLTLGGVTIALLSQHRPDLDRNNRLETFGREVFAYVPVGATIIADPHFYALRLNARRAVIAEWKTRPFGGEPLAEWERRMQDLGGFNFKGLSINQLQALSTKYHAEYVVLSNGDPKISDASARWKAIPLPMSHTLFDLSPPR